MGLSIHYNGKLQSASYLQPLIEEVKDIAEIYHWPYHIYKNTFPADSFLNPNHNGKVYGISFTPPNCETVSLSFLSNGRLSSGSLLHFYGDSTDKKEMEYLYMLFVKTQYAGIEIHKIIIHLLKHISTKYLTDFELMDEGHYWETNDEKVLEENFKRYTSLLNSFTSTLQNFPINDGESFESYFERLLRRIGGEN